MFKFKVFIDLEKEEQYLKDMAKQGIILKKNYWFGIKGFEQGESQDLDYFVEYRNMFSSSSMPEIDQGYYHLCGSIFKSKFVYVRKSETKPFNQLELAHYRKDTFLFQLSKAMFSTLLLLICLSFLNEELKPELNTFSYIWIALALMFFIRAVPAWLRALNTRSKCKDVKINTKEKFKTASTTLIFLVLILINIMK